MINLKHVAPINFINFMNPQTFMKHIKPITLMNPQNVIKPSVFISPANHKTVTSII